MSTLELTRTASRAVQSGLSATALPSRPTVLTNARVVTETEQFTGTVEIREGRIVGLDSGTTQVPGAVDCEGAWLFPGLVELHTDNLEKHVSPRPGVLWPTVPAVLTHDAQIVASGITTVFDAIAVGDVIIGSARLDLLESLVQGLDSARRQDMLRADHFLHLRCEVSYAGALDMFKALVDHDMLQLVSVMDHSPGQRQFVNIDKYRQYYMGKHGFSHEQMEEFIHLRRADSARYSDAYRREIVALCQARGVALASHDDATLAHVEESVGFGMHIAEFPTTLEAARASHDQGLSVMMGAPNVVRGGSHSGNIAAASLASEGLLDILSSDYYPASLLDAVFRLAHLPDNDYDLPKALATVSANPARSAGLEDRGSIATGKRADLLLVEERHGHPLIRAVWRAGERVY